MLCKSARAAAHAPSAGVICKLQHSVYRDKLEESSRGTLTFGVEVLPLRSQRLFLLFLILLVRAQPVRRVRLRVSPSVHTCHTVSRMVAGLSRNQL